MKIYKFTALITILSSIIFQANAEATDEIFDLDIEDGNLPINDTKSTDNIDTNNNTKEKSNSQDTKSNDIIAQELSNQSNTELDILSEDEEPTQSETETKSSDYLGDYVDGIEKIKSSQNKARELLSKNSSPKDLKKNELKILEDAEKKRASINEEVKLHKNKRLAPQEKLQELVKSLKPAPLGLYWGASKKQLESLGYKFKKATIDDQINSYLVENSKEVTFEKVYAIFGVSDKVWSILGRSSINQNSANASEILKLYNKYYNVLAKKYGNAQQFFQPYTYEEEVVVAVEKDKEIKEKVTKENPMGGSNFLEEIKTGKAVLYSTFSSGDILVSLSISVDNKNISYLTIDYKNSKLMTTEKNNEFQNL